nr:class I SAM-dependent methyltransferase [Microbacterium album]
MAARASRGPEGRPTRGTTGTNRLRRVDRWIAHLAELRRAPDPFVVDLGYGANGVTTLELEARLRRVRGDVDVLGLEIDPERVARAGDQLDATRRGETVFSPTARVSFARGGFEVPTAGGRRPAVIRAFNVLRQYDEADVAVAWERMTDRLAPRGVLVEGTCDEIGRVCSWVDVSPAGPVRFTISLRLAELDRPSIVAERLPKALIHRNVPGERIHALLGALDLEWDRAAALAPFGPAQRWMAAVGALRAAGYPVLGGRSRWRLGELTVPWEVVSPA